MFSRLEINRHKSFIVFSASVRQKVDLANIVVLPDKRLPFTHLRVPMIGRDLEHANRGKFLGSLQAILVRWEGKPLSYSGRIQLL